MEVMNIMFLVGIVIGNVITMIIITKSNKVRAIVFDFFDFIFCSKERTYREN